MRIVIAGAGDMGFHLARLLAEAQQDIVLIDSNHEVLDYARTHLDVITVLGDSASISILEEAQVGRANLFLAMTASEQNNLMSSILAKKMGARKTVARVNNQEYLDEDRRETFSDLGVDTLICPALLAAQECKRLIAQSTVTDVFDFEGGQLTIAGVLVDSGSKLINLTISEMLDRFGGDTFRPVAILRGNRTILPRAHVRLYRNDHLYFITPKKEMANVLDVIGKNPVKVKNIMITGGNELALKTAQLLEQDYHVTIVENDKAMCKRLVSKLEHALIVRGDTSNIELLQEEGLDRMDALIALTANSESNIITCLMAKEHSVRKTIAFVGNVDYTRISQNIGVDTLINDKLIAANNVFRFVRKGMIEAIASLHGVDAEIIEFAVQKSNRVTKKKIKELRLPEKAIIAGIIRDDESIFPDGDFVIQKK